MIRVVIEKRWAGIEFNGVGRMQPVFQPAETRWEIRWEKLGGRARDIEAFANGLLSAAVPDGYSTCYYLPVRVGGTIICRLRPELVKVTRVDASTGELEFEIVSYSYREV